MKEQVLLSLAIMEAGTTLTSLLDGAIRVIKFLKDKQYAV